MLIISNWLISWYFLSSFLFFLVLCLVGLSVFEKEVLNFPSIIVNWFISQLPKYLFAFPSCQLAEAKSKLYAAKTKHVEFIIMLALGS